MSLVMNEQKNTLKYSYGKTEYTLSLLPFLMVIVAIPLIIINLIALLANFTTLKVTPNYWMDIFGLGISLVFILLIFHSAINQYNKIHVTKKGLEIRAFSIPLYRWIKVPWKEIIDIKQAMRKDRWGKTLWVIEVKKLTVWHRFLSIILHSGHHPIVLISSDMKERNTLLSVIEEHIKPSE